MINQTIKLADDTSIDLALGRQLRSEFRLTKRANIGGEHEAGFEQSFASLAYTYIQDKAPGLLDYVIGFQLVDRNEDNTKAVGVFGFKVSDQWIYAPVFFLSGDLKGHELLYLKNQDNFIPMKESWINYVINRRPYVLGEGDPRQLQQLGVTSPDLRSLSQPPPTGKYASVQPELKEWAKESELIRFIAKYATANPDVSVTDGRLKINLGLSLPAFLRESFDATKLACDMRDKYPGVYQSLLDMHGIDMLRDSLLEVKQATSNVASSVLGPVQRVELERNVLGQVKQAAGPEKKIDVITNQLITENLPEMTEKEQEKLLRDSYLIRDHRNGEEVSKVYNTQISMSLVNPDDTGVYPVLVKPGGFEDLLVIHNPHTGRGRKGFCVVARTGDDKNWDNYHSSRVFINQERQESDSAKSQWQDYYDGLADSKELTKGNSYVIVTSTGQGTCAFTVGSKQGDGCYRVSWSDYCSHRKNRMAGLPDMNRDVDYMEPSCCEDILQFNDRQGASLKSVNGKLYVPSQCKVIKVKDADKCRGCSKVCDDCTCDHFKWPHGDEDTPIQPGHLADIQMQLVQKIAASGGQVGELKIWTDGFEAAINRKRMSKMSALIHLVEKHGLREKVARELLTQNGRYYIKYAFPTAEGDIGPYATGMGGASVPMDIQPPVSTDTGWGQVPVQQAAPQFQTVPGLEASRTDPNTYDPMQNIDPHAMQTAQDAASQGQQEVFDTTMIGSMLKAVREDSLVDRYLGDLTKALDRLGRILFMFYWHNEEFMNRYGKQDMPELEDTIRNSFEVLGDLVLFLKQKTVDPFGVGGQMGEPDIEQAAHN